MRSLLRGALVICFGAFTMHAEFSYTQRTQITGGAMQAMAKMAGAFSKQAREPIEATTMVKGNRMVHTARDTAQIIDLDKQTITDINFKEKTYSVMTFDEMRKALESLTKDVQQKGDLKFSMDAKETGKTKEISGQTAKEFLLTIHIEGSNPESGQKGGMQMASDMWMAPVSGYAEVRDFHVRMAKSLNWAPGQNPMASMGRSDMAKAMAESYKKMAQMDGLPMQVIMRMGPDGVDLANLPPPEAKPSGTAEKNEGPSAGERAAEGAEKAAERQAESEARSAVYRGLGGRAGNIASGALGGFGGFGKKKKPAQEAPPPAATPAEKQEAATAAPRTQLLMESMTEVISMSASVDSSKFEVPSGFKQVEAEMLKRAK